ncbi:hypothetical protein AURDEDRAFT_179630, partial [Auricularia subglabra TFB-10046 SS5]
VPRVRTVIHRTFLGQDTPAPLLVTTTDVRAPKSAHIADNWNVEICWYFRPTEEQYRISGTAFLVPHDKHAGRRGELPPGHDWAEERLRTFNSVSGRIRASWCRPVPGSVLQPGTTFPDTLPPLGEGGTDVEREQVQTAFENFALLVVCPLAVDLVELKPVPNVRTKYVVSQGVWEETPLVP